MRPLILFVLLTIAVPGLSQQDSIYSCYDAQWHNTDDKAAAKYFRVVNDRPDGKYLVRDYYISGALQFEGVCSAIEPKLVIEGEATRYHESGKVQQTGHFEAGNPVGLHKYYYDNGGRRKVVFHSEEQDVYHQFWSRDGKPALVEGNGLAADYFPDRLTQYYEIKDSVVVASFSDDEEGNRVYTRLERLPEYSGGYAAMMEDLRAVLKYPESARRQGIEGRVYVSFVVAKDGSVLHVRVVKGIHPDCDAAAVEAVSKLTNWKPGIHDGKPVFVRFVLPIKFGLTG